MYIKIQSEYSTSCLKSLTHATPNAGKALVKLHVLATAEVEAMSNEIVIPQSL